MQVESSSSALLVVKPLGSLAVSLMLTDSLVHPFAVITVVLSALDSIQASCAAPASTVLYVGLSK